MKFFKLIFIIELVHLVDFCEASLHTWGVRGYYGNFHNTLIETDLRLSFKDRRKLVETKLVEYNSTTPKNYTIIYRYYQNYMKPVSHIEINVNNVSTDRDSSRDLGTLYILNPEIEEPEIHKLLPSFQSESSGDIEQTTSSQYYFGTAREIFLFTATIHVNNTKNVLATLTIWERDYLPFTYVLEGGPENNKSLTFLYMNDAFPSPKPYVLSSIGERQNGDCLLHFESRNVTNHRHFPSRAFSYSGEDEYLTYVRFTFNVTNKTSARCMEINCFIWVLVSDCHRFGEYVVRRRSGI